MVRPGSRITSMAITSPAAVQLPRPLPDIQTCRCPAVMSADCRLEFRFLAGHGANLPSSRLHLLMSKRRGTGVHRGFYQLSIRSPRVDWSVPQMSAVRWLLYDV